MKTMSDGGPRSTRGLLPGLAIVDARRLGNRVFGWISAFSLGLVVFSLWGIHG